MLTEVHHSRSIGLRGSLIKLEGVDYLEGQGTDKKIFFLFEKYVLSLLSPLTFSIAPFVTLLVLVKAPKLDGTFWWKRKVWGKPTHGLCLFVCSFVFFFYLFLLGHCYCPYMFVFLCLYRITKWCNDFPEWLLFLLKTILVYFQSQLNKLLVTRPKKDIMACIFCIWLFFFFMEWNGSLLLLFLTKISKTIKAS